MKSEGICDECHEHSGDLINCCNCIFDLCPNCRTTLAGGLVACEECVEEMAFEDAEEEESWE